MYDVCAALVNVLAPKVKQHSVAPALALLSYLRATRIPSTSRTRTSEIEPFLSLHVPSALRRLDIGELQSDG